MSDRTRSTAEVMHTVIGPSEAQKAEAAQRTAQAMAQRIERDMGKFACPVCERFQFTDWPHSENGCPDAEAPPPIEDGADSAIAIHSADGEGCQAPTPAIALSGTAGEAAGSLARSAETSYTATTVYTIPPTCICEHMLPFHDGSGRCHGVHGMAGFPCQCWYFRERGRPYTLHVQPDSTRIVELLERIEYNTRSR